VITIFAEHITNRLVYVLDFCFKQKKQEYKLITNQVAWDQLEERHLNYSSKNLRAKYQINPQGLLFEEGIYDLKEITRKGNEILIDGVPDALSVIFFLLSRYEEHFDKSIDQHGRFVTSQHSLVKLNLHRKPIVDILIKHIWQKIELDYTQIQGKFEGIPSFDIDVAWAYKHRTFLRGIGAFLKGKKPTERLAVLAGLKKDPYDTYAEINVIATQVQQIICFVLLADWAKYDKNIHWKNRHYGSLIRGLNSIGGMGIHPSYHSFLNPTKVIQEKSRLEEIVGHKVTKSRQHFLRVKFPETYDVLIKSGIKRDYSMGFADEVGFRAGTSFPFRYFNLKENKETKLKIFPFAYMDNSFKDYLKVSPEKAILEIDQLTESIKEVGGLLMFIWHNSSMHDKDEWKGWKQVLDHTMNLIKVDSSQIADAYEI
jgi:hypothetical protein